MSLCGYYLGWPKRENIKEGQFNKLQFEPMIQKDESKIIRKEEDKLLHLTPYYNVGKIKHIGFHLVQKTMFLNIQVEFIL